MKSGADEVPQAVCAAERPGSQERDTSSADATSAVDLTPRGLELLEALNALFDTMMDPDDQAR